MNKTLTRVSIAAAALVCMLAVSLPANAIFVARICNDLACAGGDDLVIQDNAAGDTIASLGAISRSRRPTTEPPATSSCTRPTPISSLPAGHSW